MASPTLRSPRCAAQSVRAGRRCLRFAIRGGTVCPTHGGRAPQVRAKAAERVALAEALAAAEHRDPAEVLASALHSADVLHRQAQQAVANAEHVTAGEVLALVERLELAGRLARTAIELKLEHRRVSVAEREGEVIAALIGRVLDALDLTERQRRLVGVVVPRELRAVAERPALEPVP